MRYFLKTLIFFLYFSAPACAGEVPDSLKAAEILAKSGASQLALASVLHDQPLVNGNEATWAAWERLHLSLLSDLKRNEELLERVDALPADAPKNLQQTAYRLAASSALQLNLGERARRYLLQLLWHFELGAQDVKQARQMVIDSYLAEHKVAEAYQAMLRFQLDYPLLDKSRLANLVENLLASGMVKEAATWLGQLDDADPVTSLLRLETGLLAPLDASANARASLGRGGSQKNWLLVLKSASMLQNKQEEIEAQEHLLGIQRAESAWQFMADPATLRQEYLDRAHDLSNQAQLLVGDDGAWMDLAGQLVQTMPPDARALWAYLSVNGALLETREGAQARLFFSLLHQGLGVTGVRLLRDDPAQSSSVEQVIQRLQVVATDDEQRAIFLALASLAEEDKHYAAAAAYFLQAAMLKEGDTFDPLAIQAYLSAADNLSHAGFEGDSRAVLGRIKLIKALPQDRAGQPKKASN